MTSDAAPSVPAPTSTSAEGRRAFRGRVVLPHEVLDDGAVIVDGATIAWVGRTADAGAAGYGEAVAAAGQPEPGTTVLPGLVDLHDHGGGGASFPDAGDADTARVAVREHLAHGTTSLVASLVTAPRDVLLERTAMLADLADAGRSPASTSRARSCPRTAAAPRTPPTCSRATRSSSARSPPRRAGTSSP
ncbi:hypothetical protein [Luteimicrobium album]